MKSRSIWQNSLETGKKSGIDHLPQDSLALIHNKLNFVDQIRFRAVCKSWRISDDMIKFSDHLPWAMDHYWIHCNVRNMYPLEFELFDPHSEKVYKDTNYAEEFEKLGSIFDDTTIYASRQGWLLFGCEGVTSSLFIHNPFTKEVTLLPQLAYRASVATFSTNRDEIFVLSDGSEMGLYISTFCLSRDKEWRTQLLGESYCNCCSVEYVKGKLYCLFDYGGIHILKSYDLGQNSWETIISNLHFSVMDRYWLIEKDGDLIMACKSGSESDRWSIFKFDSSKMIWVVETSLKNTAFFISGKISFSEPLVGNSQDCRVFFFDDEFGSDGKTKFMCYSFTKETLIKSEEYDWINRRYSRMNFIKPPYLS